MVKIEIEFVDSADCIAAAIPFDLEMARLYANIDTKLIPAFANVKIVIFQISTTSGYLEAVIFDMDNKVRTIYPQRGGCFLREFLGFQSKYVGLALFEPKSFGMYNTNIPQRLIENDYYQKLCQAILRYEEKISAPFARLLNVASSCPHYRQNISLTLHQSNFQITLAGMSWPLDYKEDASKCLEKLATLIPLISIQDFYPHNLYSYGNISGYYSEKKSVSFWHFLLEIYQLERNDYYLKLLVEFPLRRIVRHQNKYYLQLASQSGQPTGSGHNSLEQLFQTHHCPTFQIPGGAEKILSDLEVIKLIDQIFKLLIQIRGEKWATPISTRLEKLAQQLISSKISE